MNNIVLWRNTQITIAIKLVNIVKIFEFLVDNICWDFADKVHPWRIVHWHSRLSELPLVDKGIFALNNMDPCLNEVLEQGGIHGHGATSSIHQN